MYNDPIGNIKRNRIQKSYKGNGRHRWLGELKFEIAGIVRLLLRAITKESCTETLPTASVLISLLWELYNY